MIQFNMIKKDIPAPSIIPVPISILSSQKHVTLTADILFIDKLPFLATLSHNILFGTVEFLHNQSASTILRSILKVCQLYHLRKFQVCSLFTDEQFHPLTQDLLLKNIILNTCSANEHVPDIERFICIIKECVRCSTIALPF
jgi:hypothetical protein